MIMAKPEDFPLVSGTYRMTSEWSIVLPQPFRRRIENGSRVLWRPGITAWINVWNNDNDESREARLSRIQTDRSSKAFNNIRRDDSHILRYAYRLHEKGGDNRMPALYAFAIGTAGHVQMAVYFDSEETLSAAEGLWQSLREQLDAT